MSSSALHAVQMFDPSALGDLLSANLSKPEITSMMVFTTSGEILAHASTTTTSPTFDFDDDSTIDHGRQAIMELRRMRDLASIYGGVFAMNEEQQQQQQHQHSQEEHDPYNAATSDAPIAPYTPDATLGARPLSSNSASAKEMYIFHDDDFVSVTSRLSDKLLLAVIGPSSRTLQRQAQAESQLQLHMQTQQQQQQQQQQQLQRDNNVRGSPSRKTAKTTAAKNDDGAATSTTTTTTTARDTAHALHPGAAEDTRFSSSAPDSYSMFSTNGTRSQHLRSFSEYPMQMYVQLDPEARGKEQQGDGESQNRNHGRTTRDEVYWRPDERQQDELVRLANLHVSTLPEVLYALESKALALSMMLSRVFAGLHIPKAF